MAILSKEEILKAKDADTVVVNVPKWGGDVIVSTMTGNARDRFESSIVGKNGGMNMQNIRAKLVAACVVDEDGKLLFTQDDIVALSKKSSVALDKVFNAAQKLNAISDDDVEELAKN